MKKIMYSKVIEIVYVFMYSIFWLVLMVFLGFKMLLIRILDVVYFRYLEVILNWKGFVELWVGGV